MLAVTLSVLAGLGILTSLTRASDDDTLIVPGKSVGAVTMGMSPGEVLRILGDPDQSGKYPTSSWYLWFRHEGNKAYTLQVNLDGSGVIAFVVQDPRYATSDGVAVGVSELRVKTVLGDPEWRGPLSYDTGEVYGERYCYLKLGLWVDFRSPEGRVIRLWVRKPNDRGDRGCE
jgi:outer membrane protein assembly factor BamE (lipoprotein component of BamABCDE complex)